ncbi:hypothetical protein HYY70_05030 [Candidatus Woesearchaeota archaeon]|nr:hypothetical protein [Candidatus Woesearchaeota archaeon]
MFIFEILLDELFCIRKYKSYILEKSGLSEEEYDKLMVTLFKYIELVPTEEIEKNWNE